MSFYDLLERFLRKTLGSMVENELAKEDKYVGMSLDELRTLSSGRLIDAAVSRAEYRMQDYYYADDGFAALNRTQKIIYTTYWLELEVNNGGLCQFFTNSSRVTAPFVSEALEAIGATKHKKLYDGFTAKYRIDTRTSHPSTLSTQEPLPHSINATRSMSSIPPSATSLHLKNISSSSSASISATFDSA